MRLGAAPSAAAPIGARVHAFPPLARTGVFAPHPRIQRGASAGMEPAVGSEESARFVQGNRERVLPARALVACFPHAPRAGSVARALDGEPRGLRHGTESVTCGRIRFPAQRRQRPWSGTASRRILAGKEPRLERSREAQGRVASPAVHGSIT